MQLRNRKSHKVSGLGRPGALLLILSVSGLPLAAQHVTQLPNNVRQQVNVPAAPKPAGQAQQRQPASPANGEEQAEATLVSLRSTGPRRDPFSALIGKDKVAGVPDHLPPGKAGLVIATLRVDGIVQGPNGMIAIVSNAQQRVYFLRDGDRLYDGQVEKIRMDGISFHQSGKDPFGKPVEREIDKRLYPTPGEQQ
jgi:hypothetical protein